MNTMNSKENTASALETLRKVIGEICDLTQDQSITLTVRRKLNSIGASVALAMYILEDDEQPSE